VLDTPQAPPEQALTRDGWVNRYLLDGTWLYRADPADTGVAGGWWRDLAATAGWSAVAVPNAYNAGDFSTASMNGSVGWYRKDFLLPAGPSQRQWIVRFESVNYRAEVWCNGHWLGSHTGADIAFELDLRFLHRGVNRLIVRVDDRRSPTDIPPGPGGGWWNFGGIVREVYLRPVLRADLAQVIVRPELPCPAGCPATIVEQALVRNVTGRRQRVVLRGRYGRQSVDFGAETIAPHATWSAQAIVHIPHPHLWSIDQPTLYRASLTLTGADGTWLGGYVTYSGIRTIRVTAGGLVELNGRVLHLRGAFIHEQALASGSALDSPQRRQLVAWLQELGGHLIRSHYPLAPEILELADQDGILVWDEIPVNAQSSPYLGQPAERAQAEAMLQANILTNENHPSVMLWSVGNELSAPTTPGEAGYIRAAAALAHRLDPTRPVGLAISAWPGLACQPQYGPVDVLGFNDYFGWFDAGGGTTDDRDALGPFLDTLRACYPTKGLFVTEFGFDANRAGPVEERGTYAFQSNAAAYHLGVFATKPWLAGAVYFTLQEFAAGPGYSGGNPWPDSPFNQKGLVTLTGALKPAFATVAAIYHATQQLGPPPPASPPAAGTRAPRRSTGRPSRAG
jgi:beta-glucuronidase